MSISICSSVDCIWNCPCCLSKPYLKLCMLLESAVWAQLRELVTGWWKAGSACPQTSPHHWLLVNIRNGWVSIITFLSFSVKFDRILTEWKGRKRVRKEASLTTIEPLYNLKWALFIQCLHPHVLIHTRKTALDAEFAAVKWYTGMDVHWITPSNYKALI